MLHRNTNFLYVKCRVFGIFIFRYNTLWIGHHTYVKLEVIHMMMNVVLFWLISLLLSFLPWQLQSVVSVVDIRVMAVCHGKETNFVSEKAKYNKSKEWQKQEFDKWNLVAWWLSDRLVVCSVFTPPFSIGSAHLEPPPRWYQTQPGTRYYPRLLSMENQKRASQAEPSRAKLQHAVETQQELKETPSCDIMLTATLHLRFLHSFQ